MNDTSNLQTLRDWMRWTVSQFHAAKLYYGHGTDNAWDDALALILHALHLPHDINRDVLDARLTDSEKKAILNLLNRRIFERVPVPYLTHEAWFAGLPFYVDERVLIPRSPFGELIENQFEPWLQSEPTSILDLCTGSGCIAIACAAAFPEAIVDASDISKDALTVAQINIERHHMQDQVHLYHSDLFASLPAKKYDLIVSNPPYVDDADMQALPAEFHHEPQSALIGGHDGLNLVRTILLQAKNHLSQEGLLIVETGNSEYALANSMPDVPFTWIEFSRGGGGVFLLTAEQLASIPAR